MLDSGFLQTPTGSRLRHLFVEALMRSVQPKGDLSPQRLREIVEVICHLPPVCWADAFGEPLNFPGGTDSSTVVGFIQSQLVASRLQRDAKIANGELLTDRQWRDFKDAVRESRTSIRPWLDSRLNSTLMKLEDGVHVRPSPQEARLFLGEFLQRLDEAGGQQRFPKRHTHKLHQLWQSLEVKTDWQAQPKERADTAASLRSGAQRLVNSTNSALNTLGALSANDLSQALSTVVSSAVQFAGGVQSVLSFVFAASPETPSETVPPTAEVDVGQLSLLSTLLEIERKATFYDAVDTRGPRVPEGIAGKLLYTLNALDTVGILGVAEKVRPLRPVQMPVQAEQAASASPVAAGPQTFAQEETRVSRASTFEALEALARQIDELLARSTNVLTGWRPVDAFEAPDPRSLYSTLQTHINSLDVRTPLRYEPSSSYGAADNPYASTVQPPQTGEDSSWNATWEALRINFATWLQASTHSLATMGVMALNGAAGIVHEHPRAAATVTLAAIHALISEFYSRWFPEDTSALPAARHFTQEGDPQLHRTLIHDVAALLKSSPKMVVAVKERIAISTYASARHDPQLVADVARLLEQPAPGLPGITYAERIDKTIERDLAEFARVHSLEAPVILERSQRRTRAAEWTLETLDSEGSVDRKLQDSVIALLGSRQYTLVSIPEGAFIYLPVDYYKQALNDPAVLRFFESKGMALTTVRIHQDSVSGSVTRDGVTTRETFTLRDNSGWWQVSARLLAARAILDPLDIGLPYVSDDSNAISPDVMLKFYGVPPPASEDEAGALANQLKSTGWPEITTAQRAGLDATLQEMKLTLEEGAERTHLLERLKQIVGDKPDNAAISLSETIVDFEVTAALAQKSLEVRLSLNEFLALPATVELCKVRNIDCIASPTRMIENRFEVFVDSNWVDMTDAVNEHPTLAEKLKALIETAKAAGHGVYSSASFDLQQIIRFKGFDVPTTAAEVRNIVKWLTTALPPSPPLGNFAVDLLIEQGSTASFSPADRKNIIELSRLLVQDAGSIVDALGGQLLCGKSREDTRANADTLLEAMFDTDESDAWGQQFIQKINWYGAAETQSASVQHYQQLLVTALKLAIDPEGPGRSGTIAGYDVYQAKNMGRDLSAVRADIENYLMTEKGVSSQSAPLVAHVFLAGVAPEFLVPDVEKSITMGSANWMTLRLGIAIAEATNQGCSRAMTVEQLLETGLLGPATPEQRLLFQTLAVDMVVEWGVMNGIVRQRSDFAYSAWDYKTAADLYSRQMEELGKALKACTQPLKTRRELAVIELRKVFPGTSDADIEATKLWSTLFDAHTNMQAAKGRIHGLIEVYMAGDLKPGKWWIPRTGLQVDQLTRKIRLLPDLNSQLASSVDTYFAEFKDGYISPAKLLIANLPLEDRQCLELGKVELFTLREETGKAKEFETPEHRMASRGTLGTLIRCEHGTTVSYFEFFPGLMNIIKRTDLPSVLPLNGVMKTESMRMLGGSSNVDVQRGTQLPFDFEAYRTGTAPRPARTSSKLIIERLGNIIPPRELVGYADPTTYVPNSYFSTRTTRIVSSVINDNFLQGQREFLFNSAKGTTTREENQSYLQKIGEYLLQLIPFVGCVKDLMSGTQMGLINGAFGCFTDAVSVLSGVVGGAGKALQVLKSAAPVRLKAFEAFKFTASSVTSVLNPVSGLPDMIVGGARGVRRFGTLLTSHVFQLTGNGIVRIQTGMDQLRCFFAGFAANAGSIKLPNRMNTLGASVQNGLYRNLNTTAIRNNGNWYALDRAGNPHGQPLVDFKVSAITEAATQP